MFLLQMQNMTLTNKHKEHTHRCADDGSGFQLFFLDVKITGKASNQSKNPELTRRNLRRRRRRNRAWTTWSKGFWEMQAFPVGNDLKQPYDGWMDGK